MVPFSLKKMLILGTVFILFLPAHGLQNSDILISSQIEDNTRYTRYLNLLSQALQRKRENGREEMPTE